MSSKNNERKHWYCGDSIYVLIKREGRGGSSDESHLGRRERDESDFPSSNPVFVGSDVNTVCRSVPIPDGAIWAGVAVNDEKVPRKPLSKTRCNSAGA